MIEDLIYNVEKYPTHRSIGETRILYLLSIPVNFFNGFNNHQFINKEVRKL